jgi:hypothetical protein
MYLAFSLSPIVFSFCTLVDNHKQEEDFVRNIFVCVFSLFILVVIERRIKENCVKLFSTILGTWF